jgi:hypothetical protein
MRMSVYEALALVLDVATLVVAVLRYIRSGKNSDKRK